MPAIGIHPMRGHSIRECHVLIRTIPVSFLAKLLGWISWCSRSRAEVEWSHGDFIYSGTQSACTHEWHGTNAKVRQEMNTREKSFVPNSPEAELTKTVNFRANKWQIPW
jgi:hypothetical protein